MSLRRYLALSRSTRTSASASALTLGAVGKNCAKPGVEGGRVIAVDELSIKSSAALQALYLVVVPLRRHKTRDLNGLAWSWWCRYALGQGPRDREAGKCAGEHRGDVRLARGRGRMRKSCDKV